MRITLLFLFVTSLCCAQEVTIYQSGKVTKTKVFGSSPNSFFSKEGTFKFETIDSIQTQAPDLMQKFKDFKTIKPVTAKIEQASPIVIDAAQTDLTPLYNGIDQFRKQRDAGKAMQLVGVLAMGASMFLSQEEKPDVDLIKALGAGGAACMGVGFIIDLTASSHLKFKR